VLGKGLLLWVRVLLRGRTGDWAMAGFVQWLVLG
jgi:hypothetical protein